MVKQSVHQRPTVAFVVSCTGSGVDHHSRRLIDHSEIIVFVNDVERDVFRHGTQRWAHNITHYFDGLVSH